MLALVGHQLPGGTRRIEHWENWLLTDCAGADQLPDHLVHPIALFHTSISGVGTTIAELFELAHVTDAGSVWLEAYDWHYHQPLRETVTYDVKGEVIEVERCVNSKGVTYDRFVFRIEMVDENGGPVATVTNYWRLPRVDDGLDS